MAIMLLFLLLFAEFFASVKEVDDEEATKAVHGPSRILLGNQGMTTWVTTIGVEHSNLLIFFFLESVHLETPNCPPKMRPTTSKLRGVSYHLL
jgi:hypothetical protein